jgi:osmotically-inducible protein OsmY
MKARPWLALAVIASAAWLQGCELALIGAGAGAAYSTIEDRRSSGTQLDDDAIELRAGIRIVDRFRDKVHVNVAAFNRAALITGEVPDEAVRAEVEKIVQGVPNVRGVTNEVQLAPVTSFGERTNDSLITTQVKARYLRANAFNPVHVKVVTEAGVVYLMGVVTEREADDAVDIARTSSGVRKVVKIFEYCKATDQVCRPRPPSPPDEKPKPAA